MMEVLERQGIDDAQRQTLATMRDSAQALLRIIDDVLDFSRIEAGRLELEQVAFSLSDLIESVAGTFRREVSEKGLTLELELDVGSNGALIGDPTRVRQILFNLLGNALKFTQRGSVRVHASTAPLGNGRTEIRLAVSDTGIGFKPVSSRGCSGLSLRLTAQQRGSTAALVSAFLLCGASPS
jgi:signal transduction histidine kinase